MSSNQLLIYVAAPYTKGDVAENVRRACEVGNVLLEMGHIPFVPHLSHFWHFAFPKPWEVWLRMDLVFLSRCDALLRLDGDSKGADIEVETALKLKIPVYKRLEDIL